MDSAVFSTAFSKVLIGPWEERTMEEPRTLRFSSNTTIFPVVEPKSHPTKIMCFHSKMFEF